MDEVVETSDPEELEELRAAHLPLNSPQIRLSLNDGRQSPRKRPKLRHEYSAAMPRSPVRSPSLSSGEAFSPGFQPTSEYTSPASLTRTSSPKPSSPIATPPNSVARSTVSPAIVMHHDEDPFTNISQDPLLLGGTASPKFDIRTPNPAPPASRSSSSRVDYSRPESPMTVEPEDPATPSKLPRLRSESVDPLLLFSPSRPTLSDEPVGPTTAGDSDDDHDVASHASPQTALTIPSSPLTPPPPESPGAQDPRFLGRSLSQSRSLSPPNHPDDLDIPQVQAGRYPLRERNAKQLQPYLYDRAEYKKTLRNHPEAIVKFRSPRRHHTREEDYEEAHTQVDGYEAENEDPQKERRGRGQSRSRSKSREPASTERPWTGIGPPSLPTTDEEEGKSIDALRKEGRKLRREQKRQEKQARKKARPFPLKELDDLNEDRSASQSSRRAPSRSTSAAPSLGRQTSQRSPSHRPRDRTPDSPTSSTALRAPSPYPLTPIFPNARSMSPFHVNDNADMEMHVSDSFQLSPAPRFDPGTPIAISDSSSSEHGSPTSQKLFEQSDDSEPEITSKEERKQRRKLDALRHMYPQFMINKMMKESAVAPAAVRQRRSASVSSEDEEVRPLLPGQTRTRKAVHARNAVIKGDSESSDDREGNSMDEEDEGPAPSDSEVAVMWPRRKHRTRDISLQRGSDEEVLSDGRIDDERIEAYLKEAPLRGSGLQEKDMIDWMLANTAEVGGTRRPSTRVRSGPRSAGSRRPTGKISVTTRGVRKFGRERQTLLPFKPSNRGRSRDQSPPGRPPAPAPREPRRRGSARLPVSESSSRRHRQRDASSHLNAEEVYDVDAPLFRMDHAPPSLLPFAHPQRENVHQTSHPDVLRKAARKQKEKDRRARMKLNGVYTLVAPKGSRIIGQRKAVTIDVADLGFHQALAPIQKDRPLLRRPPPSQPPTSNATIEPTSPESSESQGHRRIYRRGDEPAGEEIDVTTDGHPSPPPPPKERSLLIDFGISASRPIKFGPETYTGKGQLHELVNPPVVEDRNELLQLLRPRYFSAHGFDLGPAITVPQLLDIIVKIGDPLYEFATGLPEDGNEEQVKDWTGLLAAVCRALSYLLIVGEETQALKDAVETQILRLTSRMRAESLAAKSMDSTTFTICWFAVELPIRAGFSLPTPITTGRLPELNVLQDACTALIEHLLEYGLEPGMEPLITCPDGIDGSATAHRAFEAWVGLWHVADKYRDPTSPSIHPLWKMVQSALASRRTKTAGFEASEDAWRAILSLSTISQFSTPRGLGKPAEVPRFSACWDIVLFALERIRFEADAEVDQTVSESSLDAHDRYIRLIGERCCLLWNRWRWATDDAFHVLNRLLDIFRSRQFANLRHEKSEFPDFLRINDWTLLSRPIHSESMFVLFLKLVYQTLLVNPRTVKKLLSLATPVASLQWSKANPPSLHDLSMLFNRFSVIAIDIYIDPAQHPRWMRLARASINFEDADPTTRNAHIRGWMYLTIVMVQRNIPLDEALSWLNEMVNVLMAEHRRQTGPMVVLGIHALVVSVRNVIRTFKSNFEDSPARYPDPRLLLALDRILRDTTLVKSTNAAAHIVPRLIRSFLNVRALAVPEPRRPILAVEQESQDEYGALFFDDDVIAALDESEKPEYKTNDELLVKLLGHVRWTLYRQLVQWVKFDNLKESFKNIGRLSTDIASLTECWLGCGNIIIQNDEKALSWDSLLHSYSRKDNWPVLDTFSQRRMDFLMFSTVLRLDPMSYLTLQDTFIRVLFESLPSWHTTSEEDYIKLLLSVDGLQHPLLRDASCPENLEKNEQSSIQVLTARLPLIGVILENLSHCLGMETADNEQYIGYCINMFSAMKNIHSELDDAAQPEYAAWCLQVYQKYQTHANIMAEPRLSLWLTWAQKLDDNMQS